MSDCVANKRNEDRPATVSELADNYCQNVFIRAASKRNYMGIARVWETNTGICEPNKITRDAVLAWRNKVIDRASVTTWNTYRQHLKTMFNLGLRLGWVEDNPFRDVKPIKSIKTKKTVGKDILIQALKLLQSEDSPLTPGWFWCIVFKLYFFTGMRRRQLTALRWRHIDFHGGIITLAAESSKTTREWVIPIPAECRDDLMSLQKRSAHISGGSRGDQQVFRIQLFNPRYAGNELSPDQIGGAFSKLSNDLGVKISAHRLRHTMATQLAQGDNPDLKSLQHILGHTDLRMTMEYINPEMEQIGRLMSKLSLSPRGKQNR